MFSSKKKPNNPMQQHSQKKLYEKSKNGIVDANNAIDQLLSLLINNFEAQFNEFNPRLVDELKTAKQHMQNMNFFFNKMG